MVRVRRWARWCARRRPLTLVRCGDSLRVDHRRNDLSLHDAARRWTAMVRSWSCGSFDPDRECCHLVVRALRSKEIKRISVRRRIIVRGERKCLSDARRQRYASPDLPLGSCRENEMKPHSIVFAMAVLAGCAMSRGPAVMPGSDYQASMKGMEAAQAQASQPGDEKLTCDELQEQMLAVAQDPAFLEHIEAAGAAAEKDRAQMQAGKGEI